MRNGFTLVEILIAVTVIALLAAMGIPNHLRARHNANEGAAVGNLHVAVVALESFRDTSVQPATYPPDWATLAGAIPPYVDPVLQTGTKQGYQFTYTAVDTDGDPANGYEDYTMVVTPVSAGVTGTRGFFVDRTGVIRANALGAASAADPPIG